MNQSTQIINNAIASYSHLNEIAAEVDKAANALTCCIRNGNCIFFCGNGGSAADSMHLAAEFLGRFKKERRPLPAIALVDNICALTAIANDYGYEHVFSRQLRGLAKKGDVLVGISTSGNSPNVLEAFKAAREIGILTIALTGAADSSLGAMADILLRAPAGDTPRIQEMHITIGHILCELVENAIAPQ